MRISLVLVAACSATPAPPLAHHADTAAVPTVSLVVEHGKTVRFVDTTQAGLVVRGQVELPSGIRQLVAAIGATYALLDDNTTIEQVTRAGVVPVPAFPAGTFDIKPPDGANKLDSPLVGIEVFDDGAAWRGECHWGGIEDGGWCGPWVYAKLGTSPPLRRVEASVEHSMLQLPMLAAPVSPVVAIVPRTLPGKSQPVAILTCTQRGRTVEYPPVDERNGYIGITDLVWLQREPPIFRAVVHAEGYQEIVTPVIFEGCVPSKRFAGASIVSGPDGVTALVSGGELTVLWRGRELGKLSGVGAVVFVR